MAEPTDVILDPAVVEALAGLVDSSSIDTRARCAASLGFARVAEARAAELLEVLAQDRASRVQVTTARALARLASHTPVAVPALRRRVLSAKDSEVVLAAIETLVLCQCKDLEVAEHLGAIAAGKRAVPAPSGKGWVFEETPSELYPRVAVAACQALRIHPPEVRLPVYLWMLREHTGLDQREQREAAVAELLAHAPGGGEAFEPIFEAILALAARRKDKDLPEKLVITFSEPQVDTLLRMLLAGPVPVDTVFRRLACVPRPVLTHFLPLLRELIGAAPMAPKTLSAVRQGLASDDPLLRINAATLLTAARAHAPLAEPALASLLSDSDESVRDVAAGFLRQFEAPRPASLEALTRLAREKPDTTAGRISREALARHGAPAPLPSGGVDAGSLLRGLRLLPFRIYGQQLLGEDHTLCFPWKRVVTPTAPGAWSTDEDIVGFGRVRLTQDGPRLDVFPMPVPLPQAPTGGSVKRWLRLEARLDKDFLCTLERPFSSDEGWGTHHFFLLFTPATRSWSQWIPTPEGPYQRVAIDAQLEEARRSVGGGTFLAWVDAKGQLRTCVDPTPYFMEGARPPSDVQKAYKQERAANEAATRHHLLEVEAPQYHAQEPWVVSAPKEKRFKPLRLYGVRQALFSQQKQVRPEDVSHIRCQAAHRLSDASGRLHLVLFIDVFRTGDKGPVQAAMVLVPPS